MPFVVLSFLKVQQRHFQHEAYKEHENYQQTKKT